MLAKSLITAPQGPLIVLIAAYYPPALGGVEKVIETTAFNLALSGKVVTVLTSGKNIWTQVTSAPFLTIKRIPVFEFFNIPFAPTLIWHLLKLPKNSLIHYHLVQAYWPERVFLLCKIRRIPYIAHFHLDIEPSGILGVLFKLYKRVIWGMFLRHAHEVIVCSETQVPILTKKYKVKADRITVIYNAVSDDFFTDIARKPIGDTVRLLYVGRLAEQKKIERLINMMSFIKIPCELNIVGDGECRKSLQQLVTRLNLKNVQFLGSKNSSEIQEQFRLHDVLLIASDKEGLPLIVLEAMAAGLPIIGSRVIGITDLVADTGILVEAPYSENFAAAVQSLVVNPQLLQRLSQQSIQKARLYSWNQYNTKLAEVYKKVERFYR